MARKRAKVKFEFEQMGEGSRSHLSPAPALCRGSVDWRKSCNTAAICCPGIVHVKKPALIRLRSWVRGGSSGNREQGGCGGVRWG